MGTRMYPVTSVTEILEKLAGVPAGTEKAIRLKQAAARQECESRGIKTYSPEGHKVFFEMLNNFTPNERRYYDFILYGWGHLTEDAFSIIYDMFDGEIHYVATVLDHSLAEALLKAQGVTLPDGITLDDIKGVKWY